MIYGGHCCRCKFYPVGPKSGDAERHFIFPKFNSFYGSVQPLRNLVRRHVWSGAVEPRFCDRNHHARCHSVARGISDHYINTIVALGEKIIIVTAHLCCCLNPCGNLQVHYFRALFGQHLHLKLSRFLEFLCPSAFFKL